MSSSVDGLMMAQSTEHLPVDAPESVGELQEIIRAGMQDRVSWRIASGGTRQVYGNPGRPVDRVLSLAKMKRIITYEPDNMTIALEPGCTIADIHAALRGSSQQMALDVAHPETATIGGSYATGLSGPRRLAGGSLKDWVIGVEVVGADGALAKAGGMVVKNVTGFDMMHVHYAALGAFGVVTRLNLKVFPAAGTRASVVAGYATASEAFQAATALLSSQLQPASVLVSRADDWQVLVTFDSPSSSFAMLAQRVIGMLGEPRHLEQFDGFEAGLQPFVDAVTLDSGRTVVRVPCIASEQLAALQALPDRATLGVCADPGSGLMYMHSLEVDEVDAAVAALERQVTWLARPHYAADMDGFGAVPDSVLQILQRMKTFYDPYGQFNPGRYIAGL